MSHWARVQLVTGRSAAARWDLSASVGETRLAVGSSPQHAGWVVEEVGVAPVHFELAWDGRALWLSPSPSAVVMVDGQPVMGWTQLVGQQRVSFGRAHMAVEASGAQQAATAAAPHAQVFGEELPTDPSDAQRHWGDDEPTNMYTGAALTSDSTQMIDPSMMVEPAEPSGVLAPRLGGGTAPAPQAPTPDSTRIVDPSKLDPGRPTVPVDLPSKAPPPPTPAAPRPPPRRPPVPGTTEKTAKFQPPPPSMTEKKKRFEMPPKRTLILLGVTLLVCIGAFVFLGYRRGQRAEARAALMEQQRAAERVRAEEAAARVRENIAAAQQAARQVEAQAMRDAESAWTAALQRAEEEAVESADRRTTEEELDRIILEARRIAGEKLAIDAVSNNHYDVALAHYQRLAQTFGDEGTYEAILPILRAKLRCQRAGNCE